MDGKVGATWDHKAVHQRRQGRVLTVDHGVMTRRRRRLALDRTSRDTAKSSPFAKEFAPHNDVHNGERRTHSSLHRGQTGLKTWTHGYISDWHMRDTFFCKQAK